MPVLVKTCGLSDRPAVDAALAGGARYLGFVFFLPSPRHVAPNRAAALSAGLPDGTATVGVVVNPDDELLDGILSEVRLDYIQLHGNESPARARGIRARTGCRIIKAISVSEASDIERAEDYGESAELILFDAKATVDDTRPRRQRADARLAAIRVRAAAIHRLASFRRVGRGQRRRGDQDHPRPGRRCLVGYRIGTGAQGPGKISAFLAAAAAADAPIPSEATA